MMPMDPIARQPISYTEVLTPQTDLRTKLTANRFNDRPFMKIPAFINQRCHEVGQIAKMKVRTVTIWTR